MVEKAAREEGREAVVIQVKKQVEEGVGSYKVLVRKYGLE